MYIPVIMLIVSSLNSVYCENTTIDFSDFLMIHRIKTFMDKTMLIQEFVERNRSLFITAPRGFGKSTNLGMLRYFFQPKVDEKGNTIEPETTDVYKIFQKFKIFRSSIFKDYFQKHPVIHLNLRHLFEPKTLISLIYGFKQICFEAYKSHNYLAHSEKLSPEERAIYNSTFPVAPSSFDLGASLKNLSKHLFLHYGKKAVLLVDEYDGLLQGVFAHGLKKETDEKPMYINFATVFSNAVKKNKYLLSALFTGRLTFGGSVTSLLDDIEHVPFYKDPKIAKFYGLTQAEVEEAAARLGSKEILEEVEKYFKGHSILGTEENNYNTYVVFRYMKKRALRASFGNADFLRTLKPLYSDVGASKIIAETLVRNKIKLKVQKNISLKDALALRNKIISDTKTSYLSEPEANMFMQILQESGLYSVVNILGINSVEIRVTNYESMSTLRSFLYNATVYGGDHDKKEKTAQSLANILQKLDKDEYDFETLAQVVTETLSGSRMLDDERQVQAQIFLFSSILPPKDHEFKFIKAGIDSERDKFPNIFLLRDDGVFINIDINYVWEAPELELNQLIRNDHKDLLSRPELKGHKVERFILIGLRVQKRQMQVEVAFLQNSTNIKDAKTVTFKRR